MAAAKMLFALAGFREAAGFRIFNFEGIASDWTRTEFTVRTDLALSRQYGIRLQELPLLCRAVLERHLGEPARTFTFTEEDMSIHADHIAERERAARQRRSHTRRPNNNGGAAWRTTNGPLPNR